MKLTDEEFQRVDKHRLALFQFGGRRTDVAYIGEGELMKGEFETSFANNWASAQYGGFSIEPEVMVVIDGKWVECRVKSEHLYTNNRDMMCIALRLHHGRTDEILSLVEVHLDGRV